MTRRAAGAGYDLENFYGLHGKSGKKFSLWSKRCLKVTNVSMKSAFLTCVAKFRL
jgi:hypothetical protein